MAVRCPLSVVSCLQHSCLRQRIINRKMIPLAQHRLGRIELRGAKEATLRPLGDAGEGPQAVPLQEVYEAQIAVYICRRMGCGDDVPDSHEPEEQDHRSPRCHVLHMGDIGTYGADDTSQVLVEEEDAPVAPYPDALGREEDDLGSRLTVTLHHVGRMLEVACYRHLMPTLHEGLHSVEGLYLGATSEEAGNTDESFHPTSLIIF